MSVEEDHKAAAIEKAAAILGEHFDDFALCVSDQDYYSFRWNYSREMLACAMFERAAKEMKEAREGGEIDWDYEEEEDDEEEYE